MALDAFDTIEHPQKALIIKFCEAVLAADSSIEAGIKWNSVSFKTSEWFATHNKRALDRVEFVFHLGAKVKSVDIRDEIPDLAGCLEWKSSDRCIVTFRKTEVDEAFLGEFRSFVVSWIKHVK